MPLRFRYSQKYQAQALYELDRELVNKSLGAAPGFLMGSIWVMYHRLETVQYAGLVGWLGVLLMFLAVSRYGIAYLFEKTFIDFQAAAKFIKYNIVANGIFWSTTIMVSIVELRFKDANSNITTICLLLGFVLSSMMTLSNNLRLSYFFQSVMVAPAGFCLFYLAVADNNDMALSASVILLITFFYMLNQNRIAHTQVVNRIQYALDLEFTNKLLQESQAQLIEEKAKLQHSTRLAAIGEISGEIAHEINNPLALVLGYIELASDQLASNASPKEVVIEKLNKATKAISRITKIIKGLRQYSRGTLNEPFSIVLLSEIVDDVMDFCSEKFNHHAIQLDTDFENDCQLNCRPVEISQVVLNIVSNAIDEIVKLPIEQRKIKIKTEIGPTTVKLLVANSGPKIDPAIKNRLFEPFFSTKKVGIGTGLGLSISKNIVDAHSGRLYYDDSGELTVFVVELPVYA